MNSLDSLIEIRLLADCIGYIPQLAELWYQELGRLWLFTDLDHQYRKRGYCDE